MASITKEHVEHLIESLSKDNKQHFETLVYSRNNITVLGDTVGEEITILLEQNNSDVFYKAEIVIEVNDCGKPSVEFTVHSLTCADREDIIGFKAMIDTVYHIVCLLEAVLFEGKQND